MKAAGELDHRPSPPDGKVLASSEASEFKT